jgi:hypothetical protein
MSIPADLDKLSVEEFSERCSGAMVPLNNTFSYFPAIPLNEEDVKDYLEDPVAALPPAISAAVRGVSILLVPYLEKPNGKEKNGELGEFVSFERPPEHRQAWSFRTIGGDRTSVVLAIKDREVADYHYQFYRAMATLAVDNAGDDPLNQYFSLLREELSNEIHGEVDEQGWRLKQALLRRQTKVRRETKLFREYARHSFIDTLTLYLHGICCDIDVETGPRQLPSRHLRRRLELLASLYPPPEGYAVFPEELSR